MPARKAFTSIYHIILFILMSFIYSCSDQSPNGPQRPGRRDYVWNVDTISLPDNLTVLMLRMWGSDPENVWAVGMGGVNGIWHYDGKKWSNFVQKTFISPMSIFGFGRDIAWIGDAYGKIWKCTDSKNWYKHTEMAPHGFPYPSYGHMWGVSPNEIYAGGYAEDSTKKKYKLLLNKFDGTSWKFVDLPEISSQIIFVRKHRASNNLLLITYKFDKSDGDFFAVYSYDGTTLNELYIGKDPASLEEMNGEVYVQINKIIYKYKDEKLVLWKDFRNTAYSARIWGRNENDFFVSTIEKGKYGIGHCDGSDIKVLFCPEPNYAAFSAIIFEKEVFFLGDDLSTNTSIIVHGKLKGE